jgi:hypothetical protein
VYNWNLRRTEEKECAETIFEDICIRNFLRMKKTIKPKLEKFYKPQIRKKRNITTIKS